MVAGVKAKPSMSTSARSAGLADGEALGAALAEAEGLADAEGLGDGDAETLGAALGAVLGEADGRAEADGFGDGDVEAADVAAVLEVGARLGLVASGTSAELDGDGYATPDALGTPPPAAGDVVGDPPGDAVKPHPAAITATASRATVTRRRCI